MKNTEQFTRHWVDDVILPRLPTCTSSEVSLLQVLPADRYTKN